MTKEIIFGLVGGLGLFLYGIHLMGDGLQKVAGSRMRKILNSITGKPIKGVMLGAGVTSIIQSSSATTVMVVGFINAGLLTLYQGIGVVLGANVGTTMTAQVISFQLDQYALPVIGIGLALNFFSKKTSLKNVGLILLGFGILFFGLTIMKSAMETWKDSGAIDLWFVMFKDNPLLAVIVGMVATGIVQSSSATVGIIIALAATGIITDLRSAIPLILGCNLGTCVTALIASINTTISAKRAAFAHLFFNVFGAIITMFVLFPLYLKIIPIISGGLVRQIANIHTLIKVVDVIIFLPFLRYFTSFIERVIPGKETIIEYCPKYLEKRLLNTPSIAIEEAKKELVRMMEIAKEMIVDAMAAFLNGDNDAKLKKIIFEKEKCVNELQEATTKYLVEIAQRELSQEQSEKIPCLLHAVNDVERIGDISENLLESAKRKDDRKLSFSKYAIDEVKLIYDEILNMLDMAKKALEGNDIKVGESVWMAEKKINELTTSFQNNHINRLQTNECNIFAGIVFLDMIKNFEKIGDHLNNIADAVCGGLQWHNGECITEPQEELDLVEVKA